MVHEFWRYFTHWFLPIPYWLLEKTKSFEHSLWRSHFTNWFLWNRLCTANKLPIVDKMQKKLKFFNLIGIGNHQNHCHIFPFLRFNFFTKVVNPKTRHLNSFFHFSGGKNLIIFKICTKMFGGTKCWLTPKMAPPTPSPHIYAIFVWKFVWCY